MLFELTGEEEMVREAARRIAADRLAPLASTLDRGEGREAFFGNLKALAESGFMGIGVRLEYGGAEAGTVALALSMEELGYACAATTVTVSGNNLVGEILQAAGSERQKAIYLPRLMSGELRAGSFCLTESVAGSDPAAMATRAARQGNGYVIDGEKIYITSAEYADLFIVWAVTDPTARRGRGITCFLVDRDNPGLRVGRAERKMGQIGSATNVVHFSECVVGMDAVLGRENEGFRIAVEELAGGRISIGALALGVGRAALDAAKEHVLGRRQGGRRLGDRQGLRWMIAECETRLEAARLLILSAAVKKDSGGRYFKEASMAKLFASEAAQFVTDTAVQVHGGAGYLKDYLVERLARDVRVTRIYEGASEIQRDIIAREVLGRAE